MHYTVRIPRSALPEPNPGSGAGDLASSFPRWQGKAAANLAKAALHNYENKFTQVAVCLVLLSSCAYFPPNS